MSAHPNPWDEATMLAVVDDLENALQFASSGSTPARYEQLLVMARDPLRRLAPADAVDAVHRRQAALDMAIHACERLGPIPKSNGVSNGVTQWVLDRAREFDLFLDGAPPLRKLDTEPTVLALQGQEHVALRTRDDAIETVHRILGGRDLLLYEGRSERLAMEVVDALMDTPR